MPCTIPSTSGKTGELASCGFLLALPDDGCRPSSWILNKRIRGGSCGELHLILRLTEILLPVSLNDPFHAIGEAPLCFLWSSAIRKFRQRAIGELRSKACTATHHIVDAFFTHTVGPFLCRSASRARIIAVANRHSRSYSSRSSGVNMARIPARDLPIGSFVALHRTFTTVSFPHFPQQGSRWSDRIERASEAHRRLPMPTRPARRGCAADAPLMLFRPSR